MLKRVRFSLGLPSQPHLTTMKSQQLSSSPEIEIISAGHGFAQNPDLPAFICNRQCFNSSLKQDLLAFIKGNGVERV